MLSPVNLISATYDFGLRRMSNFAIPLEFVFKLYVTVLILIVTFLLANILPVESFKITINLSLLR